MAISFWWLWRGDRKDMGATHENKHIVSTQKGLRSVTDLPDGTHVWLNADSHISYNDDFGESTREVTLTGEAFFDVAHNEAVPMIVHAKTVNILVKGTAFNVRSYPESDKVQTSLIRGSIELTTLDHPGQKILLKPNEKITIDVPSENTPANSDEHRKVQPAKIKEAKNRSFRIDSLKQSALTDGIPEISWIKNQLVFDNELFVDVIDKMEKWYNVDILLQNQNLGQKRFSGAFVQEENITEALSALRIINNFDFEIRGQKVIIK